MRIRLLALGGVMLVALACGGDGDEEEFQGHLGGDTKADTGPTDEELATNKAKNAKEALNHVFTDEDFSELDIQHRDPFRSYARAFKAQAAAPAQRRVLMPSTSLDEMKLIAIVTGIATPRAMLTDTTSVGHVVRRGDYVGRPEVVQTGGGEGMAVTLNWRVDRIRAGSVVLTREDPSSPDKPPLTRVMPLHEGGQQMPLSAQPTAAQ
ncbi:MAG: pilus assembly protein PilP [Polyangiales bacterium]